MLPSAIFPDHMWQEFFWGRKIQNSFPPKFQVTSGGCAQCVLWFHVPLAWCPVFEQHSFQWRKQEVAQIKGFCLFPAEEDLHSGTARKPVLPTQRTAFPEEQTHVPCPRLDSLQGREKRACPKINTELPVRRTRTSPGKKGTGGKKGESSGRRRKNKTPAQSREISKEKTGRGEMDKSAFVARSAKAEIMVGQRSTDQAESTKYLHPKLHGVPRTATRK